MSAATKRRPAVVLDGEPATVAALIAVLQKQNPRAIVLWNGNYSCVAHAIDLGVRATKVSSINGELYSLIGGDRELPAVLIDVCDPP